MGKWEVGDDGGDLFLSTDNDGGNDAFRTRREVLYRKDWWREAWGS